MKKKLLFIAFPLVATLASCSYGGISKVSLEDFNEFYASGDLANQKSYDFKLGDDISYAASIPTDEGKTTTSMSLASSSYETWVSKQTGNSLSFHEDTSKFDEDNELLETVVLNGGLSLVSKKVYEEDEETQTSVLLGRLDTYTFNDASTFKSADSEEVKSLQMSYGRFYGVDEETGKFDKDPSRYEYTFTRSLKVNSTSLSEDEETRTNVVTNESEQYSYTYYSASKYSLSYSLNSENKVVTDVKSDGMFVGKDKVVDIVEKTTVSSKGNVSSDSGSNKTQHLVYNYVNDQYVKDEGASSETSDESYRFAFDKSVKDKFAPKALLKSFETSTNLATFLVRLNATVQSLFKEFEAYHDDETIEGEIIRFADTYQYRMKVDDESIVQYTFVEGKENDDRLTNIVGFSVESNNSLVEFYKITLLY